MNANDNEPKLVELCNHNRMNVTQCMEFAKRNPPKSILIVGEGHNGEFVTYSSAMSLKDAHWLLEMAQEHVRRNIPIC